MLFGEGDGEGEVILSEIVKLEADNDVSGAVDEILEESKADEDGYGVDVVLRRDSDDT